MGGPPIDPPAQCEGVTVVECGTCDGCGTVIQHAKGCPCLGQTAILCECPEVTCTTCKGTGEETVACGNDAYRRGLCHEHLGQAKEEMADRRLSAARDGERY